MSVAQSLGQCLAWEVHAASREASCSPNTVGLNACSTEAKSTTWYSRALSQGGGRMVLAGWLMHSMSVVHVNVGRTAVFMYLLPETTRGGS